jgi:voltage-dependent anion channel protein 2
VHLFDDSHKTSVAAELVRKFSTNENTFTIGGLYAIDPQTAVKMRLNNLGKMAALLRHKIKPNSFLTISCEFDTKKPDLSPRFGLALALKP